MILPPASMLEDKRPTEEKLTIFFVVPDGTTCAALRKIFSKVGPVERVEIRFAKGDQKRRGYVSFKTADTCQKALQMNPRVVLGGKMVSLQINLCRTNLEKKKPPVKKAEEVKKTVQKKQEKKLPERNAPPRRRALPQRNAPPRRAAPQRSAPTQRKAPPTRGFPVPQKKANPQKQEKKVEKPQPQRKAAAAVKRKPEPQKAPSRPKKRKRLWPVYDRFRYGPLPNLLIAASGRSQRGVQNGRGGRDSRPSNNRGRGRGNHRGGSRSHAPREALYKETPKAAAPKKQSLFPTNASDNNSRDDVLPPRPTRGAPPRRQAYSNRNHEQKRETSIITKSYRKEQNQQVTKPKPLFPETEEVLPPRHGYNRQSNIQTRGYQAEKNFETRGYQPEKTQNRGYQGGRNQNRGYQEDRQQNGGYQSSGRQTNATPLFPQQGKVSSAPKKEPLFQEQKSEESNSFRPRAPPNRNRGRGNARRNRGYNEGDGRKNRGRLGGFNEGNYKTGGQGRGGFNDRSRGGYNNNRKQSRYDNDGDGSYGGKGRGSSNQRGGRGRGNRGRKPYQRFAGWDGSTRFSMY